MGLLIVSGLTSVFASYLVPVTDGVNKKLYQIFRDVRIKATDGKLIYNKDAVIHKENLNSAYCTIPKIGKHKDGDILITDNPVQVLQKSNDKITFYPDHAILKFICRPKLNIIAMKDHIYDVLVEQHDGCYCGFPVVSFMETICDEESGSCRKSYSSKILVRIIGGDKLLFRSTSNNVSWTLTNATLSEDRSSIVPFRDTAGRVKKMVLTLDDFDIDQCLDKKYSNIDNTGFVAESMCKKLSYEEKCPYCEALQNSIKRIEFIPSKAENCFKKFLLIPLGFVVGLLNGTFF
ncbi:MAG: hypothetical protein FWC41_04795 [Firmicutes bacterium]|nr:hypothetical protein [Bacillota bacterium]